MSVKWVDLIWQEHHSLGARSFLSLLFHTCCTVAVASVDLGFNWIGGLGSLRLSLFSLLRLLHRHDLEIIETSESDPNAFFSIMTPCDDRSPIMKTPLGRNVLRVQKFCPVRIQSSWYAANSSHILFQWSDIVNIVCSSTSQEIRSDLHAALPGTEQHSTVDLSP